MTEVKTKVKYPQDFSICKDFEAFHVKVYISASPHARPFPNQLSETQSGNQN